MSEIITRAEALARGLTHYFTGRPCKRGHVSERWVENRNCTECNRLRQLVRNRTPDQVKKDRIRSRDRQRARRQDPTVCSSCGRPLGRYSTAHHCGHCRTRMNIRRTKRYYQQQAERTD